MRQILLLLLLSFYVTAQTPNGVILDTSEWIPYEYNDEQIKNSILDMSWIQEKPAGRHGKVIVQDEDFMFLDGTPARFYGGNIFGLANFADKKDAEKLADRLVRTGSNIIRMHHLDVVKPWTDMVVTRSLFGGQMPETTRKLDPDMLDKFDYMFYLLKQRGIYIFLSHISSRWIMEGDDFPGDKAGFDDVSQGFKVEGMFDPFLINLQKEYLKQLLEHVNPYTGLAMKDDPALALMEIINENTLFWIQPQGGFGINSPYYQKMLGKMFSDWLFVKYEAYETLLVSWAEDGKTTFFEDEDPQDGYIKIPHIYVRDSDWPVSETRKRDTYQFLLELQDRYYTEMNTFLRGLGVTIPIAGSNHWCDDVADIYSNAKLNFIDRHSYWTHPRGEYNYVAGQGIDPKPMVKDPEGGHIGQNARRRVYNKPFTLSEWHNCLPNPYRAEGTPIVAAYSCLHNWHPMHYAYYGRWELKPDTINAFQVLYDPTQANLIPISALLFLRQDFKEAEHYYYETLTPKQATNALHNYDRHPRVSLICKYGLAFTDVGLPKCNNPRILRTALNENLGHRSSTGELMWNFRDGRVYLNSPRTQGVVGFLSDQIVKTLDIQFEITTEFAVVLVTSLTSDPIAESDHLLVSTSADARMTGVEMSPQADKVLSTGHFPFLQQPVEGTLMFRGGARPTVYKINSNGKRIGQVPVDNITDSWYFKLTAQNRCMHYEIVR
ncbi:hypothetical protein JW935_01630 [candidate division KSB1 bacterium]|nr:hypothetical protein [candidate division KSB1 bacterium]